MRGYRSGSTLQYNLVGEYVERVNAGRRIGLLDPPEAMRLWEELWGVVDAIEIAVAKTHHAVSGFQDFGGARLAGAVPSGSAGTRLVGARPARRGLPDVAPVRRVPGRALREPAVEGEPRTPEDSAARTRRV